jgi:hypothetical protein
MKHLVFFMGISSLLLTFQINLCHIIWTSKNTPKVSLIITSFFKGLGMNLVMKINSINQKNNVRMFTTSILRCLKKNQILAKTFHLLSNIWTLFFKLSQILGQIQVLANTLEKHVYNNLVFEVHANKSLKIMYPKKYYHPHKIIYLLSPFIWRPLYFVAYIIFCVCFTMLSPHLYLFLELVSF